MIEAINDGIVTDSETVERYLHTTQREVENLAQLINDLFELSQLEAGLIELQLRLSSVQEIVEDAVQSMTAQAEAGHLSLNWNIPEEISPLTMDPRLIQRVLRNLVQNAIRHTPPDGTIQVRAHDKGTEVEVQVVDTGEGIPEQDLDRLFERSYRSDPSRSRTSGGAG